MTILSHSMNASETKWKDIEKELIIEKKSKDELNGRFIIHVRVL